MVEKSNTIADNAQGERDNLGQAWPNNKNRNKKILAMFVEISVADIILSL